MSAFLAVALLVAQPEPKPFLPGPAQPEPAYTAFPDLKPPPNPDADPGFKGDREAARAEYRKALAELVIPNLPALPAAPTPLQKVRHEQARAGFAFLQKTQQVIDIGRFDSAFYQNFLQVATDTYKVAADLHDTPAGRVRCYEARVILMKEGELFIVARVNASIDPPQLADQARFARLQAEADLLKLKAEVQKAGKK